MQVEEVFKVLVTVAGPSPRPMQVNQSHKQETSTLQNGFKDREGKNPRRERSGCLMFFFSFFLL